MKNSEILFGKFYWLRWRFNHLMEMHNSLCNCSSNYYKIVDFIASKVRNFSEICVHWKKNHHTVLNLSIFLHNLNQLRLLLPILCVYTQTILFIFQTKGTSSFGKRRNKTHTLCRRCGRSSYHIQKSTCSQCGYPAAKLRSCKFLFCHKIYPDSVFVSVERCSVNKLMLTLRLMHAYAPLSANIIRWFL